MSSKFQASSGSEITLDGKISKHQVQHATDMQLPINTRGMFHIDTNHVMSSMTVNLIKEIEGVSNCKLLGKYTIMVQIGILFNGESVLKIVGDRLDHLGKHGYAEEIARINAEKEKMLNAWSNDSAILVSRPDVIDYGTIRGDGIIGVQPTFIQDQEPRNNNYAIRTGNGEHITNTGDNMAF